VSDASGGYRPAARSTGQEVEIIGPLTVEGGEMSKEVFSRYDSADYLKTEEDIAAYLEAAAEVGGDDPASMACAKARAKALSQRLGTPGAVRSEEIDEDDEKT
jgi:hypothetical protein